MTQEKFMPKRALISVSDKTDLLPFAQKLISHAVVLYSTGGTAKYLLDNDIPVHHVSDITRFPEIMSGRLKTLHPKILGGLLGERNKHALEAKNHGIAWLDLVICNLYPFEEAVKNTENSLEDILENIDIGGPTMIRAAAKNFPWVSVVTSKTDYQSVMLSLDKGGLSYQQRKQFAYKAFSHTTHYDNQIQNYLCDQNESQARLNLNFVKQDELRYGENPHQASTLYKNSDNCLSILNAKQLQGKALSYNNLIDAQAALESIVELDKPAVAFIKHTVPCGMAINENIHEAFANAFYAAQQSAFGGIISINRPVDRHIAEQIKSHFFEVVIARAFTDEALALLNSKPNLRLLAVDFSGSLPSANFHFLPGGVLKQDRDSHSLAKEDLNIVTEDSKDNLVIDACLFAWHAVKHVKSNAIVVVNNYTTVGIGGGQVSRVDAVTQALAKAGENAKGAVLGSDGFFPFRDCIDIAAKYGIKAIIQPGGSIRDNDVIEASKEHGISLIFTGYRSFKH